MKAEQARICRKCGHGWYAKRMAKPASTRGAGSFYALGGHHGAAAAAANRANTKYQQKMTEYERWAICPSCGSTKIKTALTGELPKGTPTGASSTSPPPTTAAPGSVQACVCGTPLAPPWRYCPMCATPTGTP